MGPPSYMRSVVGRNVVMWLIPVLQYTPCIYTLMLLFDYKIIFDDYGSR